MRTMKLTAVDSQTMTRTPLKGERDKAVKERAKAISTLQEYASQIDAEDMDRWFVFFGKDVPEEGKPPSVASMTQCNNSHFEQIIVSMGAMIARLMKQCDENDLLRICNALDEFNYTLGEAFKEIAEGMMGEDKTAPKEKGHEDCIH